ncbi:ankyrin repeat domain-containing protein 7-like [Orbicella faveolata]|uniref:ankyrin repeat domain-containing protein 7-like n=1 Tax=Orbicella faveolata TaxID=48498 RepID=UPI0009E217CF|nr:ankyrin repeat domain-containing protein 7-like [Orbicella faveolata]
MDSNVSPHPEGPGDEALPLVPLNRSPPLERRQRAMALSQLSLQSMASNHYDATDAAGDDETVSMLQEKDKDKAKPFKLHQASSTGDEAEVKNILSKEPDLNLLDKSGRTPIHNAILGRHVKIIEMLLEAGADASLLDESHDAPLHTAVRTRDENLVKVGFLAE